MSKYLVLIYDAEEPYRDYSEAQWGEVFAAHQRFAAQVVEHGGQVVGGNAIQPTATAVSFRNGQQLHEGPFVDTRPPVCGYYLIEADDLQTAKAIAALCPAKFGGVELRPIQLTPTG